MFERLGRLAQHRFAWVILGWLAVAGVLQAVAPDLRSVVTSDVTAFLTPKAESIAAERVIAKRWPTEDLSASGAIVLLRPSGLSPADLAYVDELERWLASPDAPDVVTGTLSARSRPDYRDILASKDGTTQLVIVQFSTAPFEPPTNDGVVAIRDHLVRTRQPGLRTHLTGNAGVGADQANSIDTSFRRTTVITLILVVLILLHVYRSPVTVLVPLLTISLAFLVSQGIVALLAQAGMKVSSLVETFMVVIIFGAGTDYCLLIISRFREEVAKEHEYRRTLAATVAIIGVVIASSAATVVVGFMSQGVAKFGMYRTIGPATAIAVVVTLVAGLTLTPALMRAFGRLLFWPAHPEHLAEHVPEVTVGRRATEEVS